MSEAFDTRQVRRAFSRSADTYVDAASLQHEVEQQLLDTLRYYDDPKQGRAPPQRVIDLGCGPARAAHVMHQRWPKAQIIAIDAALPMLQAGTREAGWKTLWRQPIQRVCADARALPLPDASVDVLFSNLCLQWVDDLPATLAGFRRVLRPGGLLLFSTFGPQTLIELRDAFAHADAVAHVSPFAAIAQIGDALIAGGFRDPVLDRDVLMRHYDSMPMLMRELRAIGATHALQSRRRSMTGRARFEAANAVYETMRTNAGLPARWEVISAMAWAPQPGQPIRQGGHDVASIPLNAIPIRRR